MNAEKDLKDSTMIKQSQRDSVSYSRMRNDKWEQRKQINISKKVVGGFF